MQRSNRRARFGRWFCCCGAGGIGNGAGKRPENRGAAKL